MVRRPAVRRERRSLPELTEAGGGSTRLEPRSLLSAGLTSIRHPQVETIRSTAPNPAASVQAKSTSGFLVYVPKGLSPSGTYPLVVAFSPTGDAAGALNQWKPIAKQDHWIVIVSRDFSDRVFGGGGSFENGTLFAQVVAMNYKDPNYLSNEKAAIDQAIAGLPVDRTRIVLAGFSGGSVVAHDLNVSYPGFASAVIDNSNGDDTLTIPPSYVSGFPTSSSFGASRKEAIFLVGQSDARFGPLIRETIPIYQRWGWQTYYRTFAGGHKVAPANVYRSAIAWLISRPSWK
jgi:predicted esterase